MTYHVTCNTDDNYAQHCTAMLCSLFDNNKEVKFCAHILIHNLSNQNKEAINNMASLYDNEILFHIVDESLLEGLQYRTFRPLSKAAYYRVLLSSIIDDAVEKILYLDCDMIVLSSVTDLYRIDISGYALAATIDTTPWTSEHRLQLNLSMQDQAFCSGIMMINLKYWREHDAQNRLIEFARTPRTPVYLHDQDALNYVFRSQWFEIPPKWNHSPLSVAITSSRYFDVEEYALTPCIMHYSGNIKPWFDVWFPEKKYYTKYLTLSGYPSSEIKKDVKFKVKSFIAIIRYYFSKFIYPIIPEAIELLIKDVIFIISLMLTLVLKYNKLDDILLHRWSKKHI